jgi:chromosome segregation ATPase
MINQPTEDIKLPGALEKAIENGKNKVTELDVEAKRLKELAYSFTQQIATAQKDKVALKEVLEGLESQISTLRGEIEVLSTNKEALTKEAQTLRDEMKEIETQKDAFEAIKAELIKEEEEFDTKVKEKIAETVKRNEESKLLKAELEGKLAKIEEFKLSI